MSEITLRAMETEDWPAVAELVQLSTNYWYESNGKAPLFTAEAGSTRVFCEVYEALDPGCTMMALDSETGRLAGSCFYHPRETHVSLGIMNVHPNYFQRGVARKLLRFITDVADAYGQPVRLVSSAMNLDSYSLYTRAGFVPHDVFQDMFLQVPESGLDQDVADASRVRAATPADVTAIADLEMDISHIRREKDYRYFVENAAGFWHTLVHESTSGAIDGFLVSLGSSCLNMLGPGVARTEDVGITLLHAGLHHNRGRCPVFLVPVKARRIVAAAYGWGARNCELHFCQVRGDFTPLDGVIFPTFLPESG